MYYKFKKTKLNFREQFSMYNCIFRILYSYYVICKFVYNPEAKLSQNFGSI